MTASRAGTGGAVAFVVVEFIPSAGDPDGDLRETHLDP